MAIDLAGLKAVISYDPQSGIFTRLIATKGHAAGSRAGGDRGGGYRRITFAGHEVYEHILAWVLVTGEWPTSEIDHRDGDPSNNRFANLRLASREQNTQNTTKRSHSKQPYKGVRPVRNSSNWTARIRANLKTHYLGSFPTAEDAYAAYLVAAERLHGEFARAA